MKKDIFIDNNIAKNFSNPMDKEYIKLIKWLQRYDKENLLQNAYLAVSKKLLVEYGRTASLSATSTCIMVIIDKLTREGRLVIFRNPEIKEFQREYFTKAVTRKLKSNRDDHDHIALVLLSDRKFALSRDNNLIHDLLHFPGFQARVERRPEDLPYDS